MTSGIRMFFHCRQCMETIEPGFSPAGWARISVGWTEDNAILVWCERHDKRIAEIPINSEPPAVETSGTSH